MTTSHERALAANWRALKRLRGETITYSIGSQSIAITAVFTRAAASKVDGEENIVFQSRPSDILIDPTWPDDAPAAFTNAEPTTGDLVTRADGTVFQVQPSDSVNLTWRYSDGNNTFRRVFLGER